MHVTIRADAVAPQGMGHVMRMLALCQALVGRGVDVRLITGELPPAVERRFAREHVSVTRVDEPAATVADARATCAHADRDMSAWIVVDGYSFDSDYQRFISASHRLMVVDDHGFSEAYPCHAILNANIFAVPSMYVDRTSAHLLLGTRHLLLRREFLNGYRARETADVQSVLATVGGADDQGISATVLEVLGAAEFQRLERTLVVGPANRHLAELTRIADRYGVVVHPPTHDMAALMRHSDVAVSAGGQTAFELLYMGVPSVLVSVAENQDASVAELAARGAGLTPLALTAEPIRSCLDRLIGCPDLRRNMTRLGRMLIDGAGAERVAEFLCHSSREGL